MPIGLSSQHRRALIFACAVTSVVVTFLDGSPAAAASDQGVARLSYIAGGEVDVVHADTDPVVGAINAPLFEGDVVDTGDGAFTEIALTAHQRLRLASNAEVRVASLDPTHRNLQLATGTIEVSILPGARGVFPDIDTPSLTLRPLKPGLYRISVDANNVTRVNVRNGDIRVFTPSAEQDLGAGVTEIGSGSAEDPRLDTAPALAYDGFDTFSRERDYRIESALARQARYAAAVDGVSDLDGFGAWRSDPEYGQVWVPNEPANWAPYHDGRWVWEPSYGWTWVGVEPWGWAPYHYGRWFYRPELGWAWYPPAPAAVLPVWRPALVGFVSVNLSFGPSIAWVPLAPREAWHPWGAAGRAPIINRTTVNNTTIVNNYHVEDNSTHVVYRNLQVNNSVTAVTQNNFSHGNFARHVTINSVAVRRARPIEGALPIVPSTIHRGFTVAPATARRAPLSAQRHFSESFAHHPIYRGVSLPKRAVPAAIIPVQHPRPQPLRPEMPRQEIRRAPAHAPISPVRVESVREMREQHEVRKFEVHRPHAHPVRHEHPEHHEHLKHPENL